MEIVKVAAFILGGRAFIKELELALSPADLVKLSRGEKISVGDGRIVVGALKTK